MMNTNQLSQEVIDHAVFRLEENTAKIKKCVEMLTDEEIWKRPNPASNSVGNQLLHLRGNISQYIIAALGEVEDKRDRPAEFTAQGGFSKRQLVDMLDETVKKTIEVLINLDEQDLLKVRKVQGFSYSGLGHVLHAVEHFSYHSGQIAFWTKILRDEDLGFYAGMDLN